MTDALSLMLQTARMCWRRRDGDRPVQHGPGRRHPGRDLERHHPDRIAALHRSAIEAGSDLFLTNSFGANASRLGATAPPRASPN